MQSATEMGHASPEDAGAAGRAASRRFQETSVGVTSASTPDGGSFGLQHGIYINHRTYRLNTRHASASNTHCVPHAPPPRTQAFRAALPDVRDPGDRNCGPDQEGLATPRQRAGQHGHPQRNLFASRPPPWRWHVTRHQTMEASMTRYCTNLVNGRQLRAARVLAGLTQRTLGAALGVDERAIRFWERKKDRRPTSAPNDARIEQALLDHGVILFAEPTPGARLCEKSSRKVP